MSGRHVAARFLQPFSLLFSLCTLLGLDRLLRVHERQWVIYCNAEMGRRSLVTDGFHAALGYAMMYHSVEDTRRNLGVFGSVTVKQGPDRSTFFTVVNSKTGDKIELTLGPKVNSGTLDFTGDLVSQTTLWFVWFNICRLVPQTVPAFLMLGFIAFFIPVKLRIWAVILAVLASAMALISAYPAKEFALTPWAYAPVLTLIITLTVALVPQQKRSTRYCRKCKYDLTGNISGVCPECGLERPPAQSPRVENIEDLVSQFDLIE